jgi:hypothetical protein
MTAIIIIGWYMRTSSYAAGKFTRPEGPDWKRWEEVDVPT